MLNPRHVFGSVYLALPVDGNEGTEKLSGFDYVSAARHVDDDNYGFEEDYVGPANLGVVHRFIQFLDDHLRTCSRMTAIITEGEDRAITKTVFLLGAYMTLRLGDSPTCVTEKLAFTSTHVLPYRDISPGAPSVNLSLTDCWSALSRAEVLNWIDLGPDGFDPEEYAHYDNPLNGDLHVVVPDKIIAMKGPVTLSGGARWHDTPQGSRDFNPAHYAEILQSIDVQLIIRLNEPCYSADEFHAFGIAVADLFFEESRPPPQDLVVKFMLMIEMLPGVVAVHCKAGLGRTGTMIGLYLMKNHGFSAREAIAWLRIVRPGSVLGWQQQYLCEMEHIMIRLRNQNGPVDGGCMGIIDGLDDVKRMVTRVSAHVDMAGKLKIAHAVQ